MEQAALGDAAATDALAMRYFLAPVSLPLPLGPDATGKAEAASVAPVLPLPLSPAAAAVEISAGGPDRDAALVTEGAALKLAVGVPVALDVGLWGFLAWGDAVGVPEMGRRGGRGGRY